MQQVGHGKQQNMDAADALQIARAAEPAQDTSVAANPAGLEAGQVVTVTPTDYGQDSVTGRLLVLNNSVVVVQRETPDLGLLNNHFPRSGFRVAAA